MKEFRCRPGDILLYPLTSLLHPVEDAISAGEYFEDGPQARYYYHVAIALNDTDKIEADGRFVAIHPIDYGKPDVFRPPASAIKISTALWKVRNWFLGQRYDWWLIFDDVLRALSGNRLHLSIDFINSKERHAKICSSLATVYLKLLGIKVKKNKRRPWARATPQDIGRSLEHNWLVLRGKG